MVAQNRLSLNKIGTGTLSEVTAVGLEIMRDPRVRGVEWRDLVALSRWEVVKELRLPVP